MNLLLTSNGLVNDSIAQAFIDLSPKPMNELRVAFISTAKNRNLTSTDYFTSVFNKLKMLTIKKVDIIDIEGLNKEIWMPRLEAADVIYVGGGNTYYLMHCMRESGLDKELVNLLSTRLYVGDSAGAIVVTPSIDIACVDDGDENTIELKDTSGLGIVDFEVSPHTPEDVSIIGNKKYASSIQNTLYAYDNETAIKYQNGYIEFVGAGKYHTFNG